MNINTLSQNCRGLVDSNKRRSLFSWIASHPNGPFDIIFLQETHTSLKNEADFKSMWTSYRPRDLTLCAHGSQSSRGVMTIISEKLAKYVTNNIIDSQGRYLITEMQIDQTKFVMINIYAPNLEKQAEQINYWNTIRRHLDNHRDSIVILGGDFNLYLNGDLDKKPPSLKVYKSTNQLREIMKDHNLNDIWRIKNENKRHFTWRRNKPTLIQSRLDYWLISTPLTYDVTQVKISPGFKTEHSAISIKFEAYQNEGWSMETLYMRRLFFEGGSPTISVPR